LSDTFTTVFKKNLSAIIISASQLSTRMRSMWIDEKTFDPAFD
jgi:hypothetical protein